MSHSLNPAYFIMKLVCDPKFEASFFADPAKHLGRIRVSGKAIQALKKIERQQITIQRNILLDKRFRYAEKILPLTVQFLGNATKSLFFDYAKEHWPKGGSSQDALGFLHYLKPYWKNSQIPDCINLEKKILQTKLAHKKFKIYFWKSALVNKIYYLQFIYKWRGLYVGHFIKFKMTLF